MKKIEKNRIEFGWFRREKKKKEVGHIIQSIFQCHSSLYHLSSFRIKQGYIHILHQMRGKQASTQPLPFGLFLLFIISTSKPLLLLLPSPFSFPIILYIKYWESPPFIYFSLINLWDKKKRSIMHPTPTYFDFITLHYNLEVEKCFRLSTKLVHHVFFF